jgi:hypothetical protein
VSSDPTPLTHLQIAARMRTVIEQWLGDAFDIDRMLVDADEAREVLFVCQASNHPELVRLARQWVALGKVPALPTLQSAVPSHPAAPRPVPPRATPPMSAAALPRLDTPVDPRELTRRPVDLRAVGSASLPVPLPLSGAVPQDTGWSKDTSGFGVSAPGALVPAPAAVSKAAPAERPGWLDRLRRLTSASGGTRRTPPR